MQRSFKSRLEALERLEASTQGRARCDRAYYLPTEAYARVVVEAFRAGDLCIDHGRIALNMRRGGWRCQWIADALNAIDDWGDVFLDDVEIAGARELFDLGWLTYGWSDGIVIYPRPPATWLTKLSQAQTYELYTTNQPRYFAVHATGRQIDTAARIASWRTGTPIETLDALQAWLATARPFTLSRSLVEVMEPITVGGMVAQWLGHDPDTLAEIDYEGV